MHCTSLVWLIVTAAHVVLSAPPKAAEDLAAAPLPASPSVVVLDEPAKDAINPLVKADSDKDATNTLAKADTIPADKDTVDPLVKADKIPADKSSADPSIKADKDKDVADSLNKVVNPGDAAQPDTALKSDPEKVDLPLGKDVSAPLKLKKEKELADLLGKYIDEELKEEFKEGQAKTEETAAPSGTGSRYTYSEIVGQFFTNLMQIPLVFLHAFSDAVARLTATRPIPGLEPYAPAGPKE